MNCATSLPYSFQPAWQFMHRPRDCNLSLSHRPRLSIQFLLCIVVATFTHSPSYMLFSHSIHCRGLLWDAYFLEELRELNCIPTWVETFECNWNCWDWRSIECIVGRHDRDWKASRCCFIFICWWGLHKCYSVVLGDCIVLRCVLERVIILKSGEHPLCCCEL